MMEQVVLNNAIYAFGYAEFKDDVRGVHRVLLIHYLNKDEYTLAKKFLDTSKSPIFPEMFHIMQIKSIS